MEVACEGPASQQHRLPPSLAFLSHSCPLLVPGSAGSPGNTHTHRLSTCQESRSVYLESLALAVTFTQLYCDCWKGWAQPLPPPPLRGSILLWPWSLPKSPQNLPPALWLPLLSNKLCFGGRGGGSKQVNQGWSLLAGSPPGLRGPQGSHLASGSLRLASGMRAKQERQQSSEITLEGERARSGTGALQPQQMVLNFLLRPAPHDLSHGARMAVGRFSQSDHSPARPTSYGQIPRQWKSAPHPHLMGKAGPPSPEG